MAHGIRKTLCSVYSVQFVGQTPVPAFTIQLAVCKRHLLCSFNDLNASDLLVMNS
jgi:hypothetical protein